MRAFLSNEEGAAHVYSLSNHQFNPLETSSLFLDWQLLVEEVIDF